MSHSSSAASLFCDEDAADVLSSDHHSPSSSPPYSPPFDESSTIGELIDTETNHMPESDYLQRLRDRSIDAISRENSINWILKVHAHYQFRPVTAFLSVNYFDRFLSRSFLPRPSEWAFHLLSVACLSLAAKMEETQVPHLLDLQLFEPGFLFEPITVQRMEFRVLTCLNWRLRSVTPFDFLHYFISKLHPVPESMTRLFSLASHLLLTTTRVIELLRFPPSTIAAAAVVCSAGQGRDIHRQSLPWVHERVDKDMMRSCHQLMRSTWRTRVRNLAIVKGVELRWRRLQAPSACSTPPLMGAATLVRRTLAQAAKPRSRSRQKRVRSSVPDVQRQ